MLSKNRIYLILLIFVIAVFCSSISVIGAEISWRLGGKHAALSPETEAQEYFAKLVNEKTGGRMEITVYPAEQLGTDIGQVENLISQVQDAYVNGISDAGYVIPEFNAPFGPYVFASEDHIKRFYETDVYKEMKVRLINKGVRIIADNWFRLPRVVLSAKPVKTIDDLKGLAFRLIGQRIVIDLWKAIGVNPIEIAWADAYSALDLGTVDAMESPIGSIYGMGFHRVAPYILMTNHVSGPPFIVLVSEKSFQALPEDIKPIVIEAAEEAGDYYTDLIYGDYDEMKEKIKAEGGIFIENVDTTKAAELCREAALKLEKEGYWQEGLYDFIQTLR